MLLDQITSTYKEILKEKNDAEGQYERRFLINSHDLHLSVFLGITVPSNLYYFSFVIPKDLTYLLKNDQTSGLKITLRDYDQKSMRLYISLESEKFSDIFIRLAEDLINFIVDPGDTRKIISKLSNRLEKWKQFFKDNNSTSLTKEESIGLLGEIVFLNQLLQIDSSLETLLMWRGPFESKNDFVNKHKSIEVKTTISKIKDSVHISSEHQLDTNEIDYLHLAVVRLESNVSESKGFTLNELIEKTMDQKNDLWKANFKLALRAARYSFEKSGLYENQRYAINQINIYNVNDRFPKICASELAENITEVNYKLMLTGLEEYLQNKDEILKEFLGK